MAEGSNIPEEVKRLIYDCIDSIEQLEVLLFLRTEAGKAWTAEKVSCCLYIAEESARNRLEGLRRGNLVSAEGENPVTYRYAPATPILERTIDGLALAYKTRRVAVINLILEKPMDHIRSFADAFRFRRES